ncbi:MAG: hypothetical protein RLZZ444_3877 [Pseudomonadota bacterium]
MSFIFKLVKKPVVALLLAIVGFFLSSSLFMLVQTHRGPYAYFGSLPGDASEIEKGKAYIDHAVHTNPNGRALKVFLSEIGFSCVDTDYSKMGEWERKTIKNRYGKDWASSTNCRYRLSFFGNAWVAFFYADEKDIIFNHYSGYHDPWT